MSLTMVQTGMSGWLDCMLPETAKNRVKLLDHEMWKTDDFARQALSEGELDQKTFADWRSTMSQWNLFANDVLYRNNFALFSYCDVEENAIAFEKKATELRKAVSAPGILNPSANRNGADTWKPVIILGLLTVALVTVVPKLPSYQDFVKTRRKTK